MLYHDRLKKCDNRTIPPWLKRAQNRIREGENVMEDGDEIYCVCRKGYTVGEFIECGSCDEWYQAGVRGLLRNLPKHSEHCEWIQWSLILWMEYFVSRR